MASLDSYDFSGVAAHRLDEVKRRIGVLEDYTARRISSAEAIERLQLSTPSFQRLLRAWTNGARPENLGAAGRHRNVSRDFGEEAKGLIQQVEENKLSLSDPIARHVERLPAGWQQITIRQLMQHSSGLADYLPKLDNARRYTPRELIDLVRAEPLAVQE